MSSTHRHNNLTVSLFTHITQKRSISISLFAHNAHIKSRTHSKHTQAWKYAPTEEIHLNFSLCTPRASCGKLVKHSLGQGTTAGGSWSAKAGAHNVVAQLAAGEGQRRPLLVTATPLPPMDIRRRDLPCTAPPRPSFTAWRPPPPHHGRSPPCLAPRGRLRTRVEGRGIGRQVNRQGMCTVWSN
ncbi:hypothetical protein ACQJBY_015499 [Aegilops geniculata]